MKHFVLFIFAFLTVVGYGQIIFDKVEHDFGKLYSHDERHVDIYLKNTGNDGAYILSVKKPDEIVYIYRQSLILPNESGVIRLHIDKKTKGNFQYIIPVYTSDKNNPTNIVLKGRIEEIRQADNAFTSCPDFNQSPAAGNPLDFALTVVTIDKETRVPLGKSQVSILQNGRVLGNWRTTNKGDLKMKIPLGISYFYASHPGYFPAEEGQYVNFKNNYVVLELTKKEESILAEKEEKELITETDVIVENTTITAIPKPSQKEEVKEEDREDLVVEKETPKQPERIIEIDEQPIAETIPQRERKPLFPRREPKKEKVEEVKEVEIVEAEEERIIVVEEKPTQKIELALEEEEIIEEIDEAMLPPLFNDLDRDNFDSEYFMPMNVTFIVDVSESMSQYGRLDLLKFAMGEMVDMLRPEDKVGIVAYSSRAITLLKSTSGDKKEKIMEEVDDLRAFGFTDGLAGIKLGYKQSWQNRSKGGQNHVVIVTDGAFNRGVGDYKKVIEQNFAKKNITMSIVAIKSNARDEENLREAAELGKGRFVLIENLADAQRKLKQEIRLSAFRH